MSRFDTQQAGYPSGDVPSLSLYGPSARLGASYSISDNLVVHAFGGYLWQPPIVLDGPAAGRIIDPTLVGQALPNDLKAETEVLRALLVGLPDSDWELATPAEGWAAGTGIFVEGCAAAGGWARRPMLQNSDSRKTMPGFILVSWTQI